MEKKDERVFITADEATSLLNDGENIHTFVNPNGMLIGADWSRNKILELLKEHSGKIELGGDTCRAMKHGMIVFRGDSPLFIETNDKKLKEFDPDINPAQTATTSKQAP